MGSDSFSETECSPRVLPVVKLPSQPLHLLH